MSEANPYPPYDPYDLSPGAARMPQAFGYRPRLRAEGNLSYLQIIDSIKLLWEDRSPDIPFVPYQGKNFAQLPSVVYSLDMRTTITQEPKPRLREERVDPDTGRLYHIYGHRFQNIVTFTSVTKADPRLAEEIIEAFEDFMLEVTPVLKEAGVSEMVYYRRYADAEVTLDTEDLCKRTLAWYVTTEKLKQIPQDRIEQVAIDIRTLVEDNTYTSMHDLIANDHATPTINIVDQHHATPSY